MAHIQLKNFKDGESVLVVTTPATKESRPLLAEAETLANYVPVLLVTQHGYATSNPYLHVVDANGAYDYIMNNKDTLKDTVLIIEEYGVHGDLEFLNNKHLLRVIGITVDRIGMNSEYYLDEDISAKDIFASVIEIAPMFVNHIWYRPMLEVSHE